MPKFPPFSDGRPDDAALSPELEVIERRLVLDAALWELDAPAESHLEDFARNVAVLARPADTATDTAAGATPGANADSWLRTLDLGVLEAAETEPETPRRPELRARALATRPHARLTLAVVLLVAALALSVLARFAVFNPPRHGAQPTPTPTATASPTATPHASGTPTTPATGAGAGAGGSVGPPSAPGDVTRIIVGAGPVQWTDYCDGPRTFDLMVSFGLAPNSPAETITYRWLRSDGYVSPVESMQYTPTSPPNVMAPDSTWALQPAQGDGSMRWVEVEVLSPNTITSAPATLQLTCMWAIHDATATFVSGGTGTNPPGYDCQAGGDQSFTFAGVIHVDADSQSHTITYHWSRADGSQSTEGPDQTVTLAPGQLSASVPDDVVVLHQSDPNSNQYGDMIVVTSTPGVVSYNAQLTKFC